MALSAQNIHVGPARIWVGTTAPASGAPPTWAPHTNGIPATGTEVGYTVNEAVFTWTSEKTDIDAEQTMATVDQFISKQNCQLTFEALERNYTLLKILFDNIGNVDDVTRMGFYGGGSAATSTITYGTVFVSSAIRTLTNKYEILFMYRVVSMEAVPIRFSRTTPSSYAVTLRGMPDTTRTDGDMMFQFSREK
jgi:hypothetical protein